MTTYFVCSKCGVTTSDPSAPGWLIGSKRGSIEGDMIIRCPDHVTTYARRQTDARVNRKPNPRPLRVGDIVRVHPHTYFQHLIRGAVTNQPRVRWHTGYHRAKIVSILDGIADIYYGHDYQYEDVVDLDACELLTD